MGRKELHKKAHFSAPCPEVWHSGDSQRNLMMSRILNFDMQNVVINLLACCDQLGGKGFRSKLPLFDMWVYCFTRQTQIGWCQ